MTTIPYEEALATKDPVMTLRKFVADWLEEGELTREEILAALDYTRLKLRALGREGAEDLVAGVMDFLTGWCSPGMRL